jgi:hypothetical protein
MSEVIVRRAESGDLELIIEFNRTLAQESEGLRLDPERVAGGVRAQFDDPSRGL